MNTPLARTHVERLLLILARPTCCLFTLSLDDCPFRPPHVRPPARTRTDIYVVVVSVLSCFCACLLLLYVTYLDLVLRLTALYRIVFRP